MTTPSLGHNKSTHFQRIINNIILIIYVISFILVLFSNFFNPEIKDWITDKLGTIFGSLILISIATFLSILHRDDFDNMTTKGLIILSFQILFSFGKHNIIKDINDYSVAMLVLFMPTFLFIIQNIFSRINRLEDILTEIKNRTTE